PPFPCTTLFRSLRRRFAAVERIQRTANAAHGRARRQRGGGRDDGDGTQRLHLVFSFGGRGRSRAVRRCFCCRRRTKNAERDLRALAQRVRRFKGERQLFECFTRELGLTRFPRFNREQFLGEVLNACL